MATTLIPAAPSTPLRTRPIGRAAYWGAVTGALHRRGDRLEGFVVVIILLLPQLLTLLGGD